MSVEKVNKYKEQKNKRSQAQKKEKLEKLVAKIVVAIVAVALLVWVGFSIYDKIGEKSAGTDGTNVNVGVLDDYLETFDTVEADPGE